MKKWITVCLLGALLLGLAGCGNQKKTEMQGSVQLANPYVTLESEEEMEAQAGLEVSLPEALPQWVEETIYRAMPGKLAEIIYAGGSNEIRVRIAEGSEDISGVYDSDIREVRELEQGDRTLHVKSSTGEAGESLVYGITWNTPEGRTYSVTSPEGVPEDIMLAVAAEVK